MNIKTDKQKITLKAKIEKALTSSDFLNGGLHDADRTNKFETYIRGTSDMMALADIEFLSTLRANFDQEYLGRKVLRAGVAEATTFSDVTEPEYGKSSLTLKKFTGGYDVSWETMVENIEKKDYQAKLTAIFMEKCAKDLGDIAVNSDTASGTPVLNQFDGWAKLANGGYIVDAGGNTISRNVFYNGYRELPVEVAKRRSDLRWYANTLLQTDWREVYGDRATMGGDSATMGSMISPDGIRIATCDEFARDLSVGYTSATYGKQMGSLQDAFVLTTITNAITITTIIDGGAPNTDTLTMTAGTYTAPELANALNVASVAVANAAVFGAYDGKLYVQTTKSGAGQSVEVVAVAHDMYTVVGFAPGTASGVAASAAGTINNGTFAILSIPNNFKFYMHDQFRSSYEFVNRDDAYQFTTQMYGNCRIKDTSALTKVTNIRLMNY